MSIFSLRKLAATVLVAGTAMTATALAPASASAHPFFMPAHFHFGHWGHWGHGWGHWGYGYDSCYHKYVNAYGELVIVSDCD